MIAPDNFNIIEKDDMYIMGEIIVKNIEIITPKPIEFLIKTLPATTISKPSLKNPPTIGIEFEMAYLAALIDTPSKVALVIPCIVIKIENIVVETPKIHFIMVVKTSRNLFNLYVFDMLDIKLNTIITAISGRIMLEIIFIIPLDKNATAGLYTFAETFPPAAIIKDISMGDIISLKFDKLNIVFLVF